MLTLKSTPASSLSRVSWSLENRERMRPIGVVSKKARGDRTTLFNAALNIRKPATKPPALTGRKAFITTMAREGKLTRK